MFLIRTGPNRAGDGPGTVPAPTGRWPWRGPALTVAVAVVLLASIVTGCGAEEPSAEPEPTQPATASAEDLDPKAASELCATYAAIFNESQEESATDRLQELLEEHAPPDLAADVERIRSQMESRPDETDAPTSAPEEVDEDLRALQRVTAWLGVVCNDGHLVAPPLDAVPAGIEVCMGSNLPVDPSAHIDQGHMVIYGRADLEDPFTGPLLTLTWGAGSYAGDGEMTPVTVRGTDGVTGPIGVFQAVALADLGTVVAWHEDGLGFALYGRGWDQSRSDELVALAEQMTPAMVPSGEGVEVDGWEIPAEALPEGFISIHRGTSAGGSLIQFGTYSVWYGTGGEQDSTTLNGMVGPPGDEMAWRAFALESELIDVDGKEVAFTKRAWTDDGPTVASWRVDDDHYVIIASIGPGGVTGEELLELVRASRPLTDEEWRAVASTVACGMG